MFLSNNSVGLPNIYFLDNRLYNGKSFFVSACSFGIYLLTL